jgi:hypothetical protein
MVIRLTIYYSNKYKAMKKLVIATIVILFATNLQAQINDYRTAIGVKLYNNGSLTLKHFITDKRAVEVLTTFGNSNSRITGLWERHRTTLLVNNLKWYYGPGAHIEFFNDGKDGRGTRVGVDGVLGLDYKFNKTPINLSIDWQPSLNIGLNGGFNSNTGGLSVRYTF